METMSVRLPNGNVLKNIPQGTSKEQIKDAAIKLGAASIDDFDDAFLPQEQAVSSKTEQEENAVLSYLRENMELPVGLTGSAAGAVAGIPFGPFGVLAGGIAGGAIGSGGGSLLSDELTGKDLDYGEAVEEALISAGFDLATLGLGKVLKPAYIAGKRSLGFGPKETAQEIISNLPEVGTKESLQASQRFLEGKGASLTPFQAGAEGSAVLKEKIARAGLLSSATMEKNTELVNKAVADGLNEVTNRFSVNIDGSAEDIAEVLYNVISEGKQALGQNYSRGLDEIVGEAGTTLIPVGAYSRTLDSFVKDRQGQLVNELSDDTIKYIEDLKNIFGDSPVKQVGLKELITIDKKLSQDISSKFGNPQSPLYNETMEYELSLLSSAMGDTTKKILESRVPETAAKYAKLKTDYADGIKGLLPQVNKNFITQASKGNYKSLGNLLTKAGNINQVNLFKQSLKEAFNQAGKAGDVVIDRFISFDEADALIKKGFLQSAFPDVGTGEFSIKTYQTLANKLANKTEAAKYKAVLGADYPRVKQLINLMSEASRKPESNIGELFLRNKEYQLLGAGTALASGLATGVVGPAGLIGPAVGSAALFIPNVLAKAATNPKHVNKIIAYDKAKFASQEKAEAALAVILSDILDEMTEEEQAEVRNIVRDLNKNE